MHAHPPIVHLQLDQIRIVRGLVARALLFCRGTALRPPRYREEGRDEGLLYVRETEVVGDLRNGPAQLVGKLDLLVVGQLRLPELAVRDPLLQVWVREVVFPVEARWAFLF